MDGEEEREGEHKAEEREKGREERGGTGSGTISHPKIQSKYQIP